jgi:hypothetical protein
MKCLSRKCMELTCEVHCAEVGQAACILAFTVASHSRTELVYAVDNADLQVKEPLAHRCCGRCGAWGSTVSTEPAPSWSARLFAKCLPTARNNFSLNAIASHARWHMNQALYTHPPHLFAHLCSVSLPARHWVSSIHWDAASFDCASSLPVPAVSEHTCLVDSGHPQCGHVADLSACAASFSAIICLRSAISATFSLQVSYFASCRIMSSMRGLLQVGFLVEPDCRVTP